MERVKSSEDKFRSLNPLSGGWQLEFYALVLTLHVEKDFMNKESIINLRESLCIISGLLLDCKTEFKEPPANE